MSMPLSKYQPEELHSAIIKGYVIRAGTRKNFYELLREENFISDPSLQSIALQSLNEIPEMLNPQNYSIIVRAYTLLTAPGIQIDPQLLNKDSQQLLRQCETLFNLDLKRFVKIRNAIVNKIPSDLEEKFAKESIRICRRLNQLDVQMHSEDLSVTEWAKLRQNIVCNDDAEAQQTWHNIVEKVAAFLKFEPTPENLKSIGSVLLNGECDETFLFNTILVGESAIDGRRENFIELLNDYKFVTHPELYNSALHIVDTLKNKEELRDGEMQQIIRAYTILNSPNVTSLPERKFYQYFANQTYNSAIESCEEAFRKNFTLYIEAKKRIFSLSRLEREFAGREADLILRIKQWPDVPHESLFTAWEEVKKSIYTNKENEVMSKWQYFLLTFVNSDPTKSFSSLHEGSEYLLHGIIPEKKSAESENPVKTT
ncbi:MAG: hypothetical protein WC222_12055 [Parachlamydiales bacterium]|jgi:hypothetical protein